MLTCLHTQSISDCLHATHSSSHQQTLCVFQAQAAGRAQPNTHFGPGLGAPAAVLHEGADEAAGLSQLATMLVEYDSMTEGDSQSGTVQLQKCLGVCIQQQQSALVPLT